MPRRKNKFSVLEFLERFLPWLVLAILAIYTYAKFFQIPYTGFKISDQMIRFVYDFVGDQSEILPGDRIIQIGSLSLDAYRNDPKQSLIDVFYESKPIPIVVERDGKTNLVNWIIPGASAESVLNRMVEVWWMAYVLWLAGTATLLFHRPKDGIWIRLIAIYYLAAIVIIVSSGPSGWHVWKSTIVLRSAIWLGLPVFLHFHWEFPRKFHQLPNLVWFLLYGLGISLAIAEWFQIIPFDAYLVGLATTISGSLVLLIFHYILQPDQRKKLGLFNDVIFVVALPIILIRLANMSGLDLPEYAVTGAFVTFPSIPGAYFFLSYWDQILNRKRHIINFYHNFLWIILSSSGIILFAAILESFYGFNMPASIFEIIIIFLSLITTTFSFLPFLVLPTLHQKISGTSSQIGITRVRGNQFISTLLYILVVGLIYSFIIVNGILIFNNLSASIILGVGAALSAVMITLFWYPKFKRFIEYKILGIEIPFVDLLQSFSDGISESLNRQNLTFMLTGRILPNLLIRESALIYMNSGQITVLYAEGINFYQVPSSLDNFEMMSHSPGPDFQNLMRTDAYAWIRLFFPLRVNNNTLGIWLLGNKDPDDLYTEEEISILKAIANQTALALAKIQYKEQVDTLLQENIQYAEEERSKLARDLHDDILNGLVVLGMTLEDHQVSPRFENQFKFLTSRIRRMISGLRPPSLEQGIWFALQEKAMELKQNIGDGSNVDFDIPYADFRYPPNIEGQIYRIVQQACDNALLHAKAKNIRLSGSITPDRIELSVEDDGAGFSPEENYLEDQNHKLKHYGLAIMRERAELVGADFHIQSIPEHGTRIQLMLDNLVYQKDEHQARIKAESALIEREKSFREFLESLSYGIFINNEKDQIIFANEHAAKISDYSIPELLSLSIKDLTTTNEYQDILTFRQNQEKSKYANPSFETLLQKKDGKLIPLEMTVANTIWNGQRVGLAFFSDITTKKQIETAVKQSEEMIYSIFDKALDGVVMVNNSGEHLYVNQKYAEMTGYTIIELLQRNMEELIIENQRVRTRNNLKNTITGKISPKPFENIILRKDGTTIPIYGVSTKIQWQGKSAVMGYIRDLSEYKEIEAALYQSEENIFKIFNNSIDGVVLIDKNGKHLFVNDRYAEMLGFSVPELLDKSMQEMVHEESMPMIAKRLDDRFAGEAAPAPFEIKLKTKDGNILPIFGVSTKITWKGQPAVMGFMRDISLQRQAEAALRQTEQKFKSLIENTSDGILVSDKTGKHIYANPSASELTGYGLSELMELSFREIAHPDMIDEIEKNITISLEKGIFPKQIEGRIITKSRKILPVEYSISPTLWEGKQGFIISFRDISNRKQVEYK